MIVSKVPKEHKPLDFDKGFMRILIDSISDLPE